MNKQFLRLILNIIILVLSVQVALANVGITKPSTSICANYAANGPAARWTTLGTFTLKEGGASNMGNSAGAWSITLVLAPPTGWQFNAAVNPTVGFTTGLNVTSATLSSITSTALTIVIAGTNKTLKDVVTISGLQIQATTTASATGNIHPSSITGTMTGITTSTNFATITRTPPSAGTATISIAASPSSVVCAGTNVTFTATATNGGSLPLYQWTKNGINISGATTASYSSASLSNGDMIACSLISNSCIVTPTATSGTVTMTVNPLPNVSNYSGASATSPCTGSGSTLSATSTTLGSGSFNAVYNLTGANTGTGYSGTLAMTGTSGTMSIPAATLSNPGSTSVTVTSLSTAAGCSSNLSSGNVAAFTVNATPATVSVSGAGTYCGSTLLTASNGGSGTIYYEGTTSGGTSTATPSTSQLETTPGTFYFRAQSSAGCWGAEGYALVSIAPQPNSVSVSGGGTFCDSTTISASNGGSGTIYFQGTTSGGTSVATPSSSQVVTATGTYYFRALSAAGCWGPEGSVSVTINHSPAVITGGGVLCHGSGYTLLNVTNGGTWSSSNTTVATIGSATGAVTTGSNGIATISYTLASGCLATTIVSVTTTPSAISGAATVCAGSTTVYTNTAPYGTWSSSNTAIATVGSATGIVTGVANGASNIMYSTGCSSPASQSITISNSPITGNSTVCAGNTITLSNSSTGGIWNSNNTSIATVGTSSGVVTGVAGGVVTINYTNGACVATTQITVNVVPGSISGTASACVGNSSTLSNASPYGTWSSSNTSVATVGSLTGIVTAIAPGNVNINYSTGCGTQATVIFGSNALPASISGTPMICTGATQTYSDASLGGTWTSGATGIATIGSGTGIASAVATGTAPLTYTLGNGCSISTTITINPAPAAITGTSSVCTGSNTTLSDVTVNGIWYSSNSAIADIGSASGLLSGISSGTAVVSYTLPTGCQSLYSITINPLPSAISGATNVCVGQTAGLNETGGGTWTCSNSFAATIGSASGIVTGIVSNTVTITYTLPSGCAINELFTVNPLPAAISGINTVCVNATTSLSDAGGGTWTSSNSALAKIGSATGITTGVSAGTAVITYSLATGCFVTIPVTVNPLPNAGSITGATTLCEAAMSSLSDAVSGGSWSSADNTIASIDASGTVTGQSGGNTTISYTYTNSCGTDNATTGVTINPLPNVDTIAGPASLCAGSSLTLTNSVGGGVWSSTNTGNATVGSASGLVSGIAAGSTLISYTLTNGCGVDFDTTTMTILPLPGAITGTPVVCAGSSVTLTDAGGGTWSSSNSSIATIGSGTGTLSGVATGNATITYTLNTGCFTSTVATINALPAISAGSGVAICSGSQTTLTATGGSTYTWSPSAGLSATTGSSISAHPVSTTTYTAAGINSNGCAASATVVVTINPNPVLVAGTSATICNGTSAPLTASGAVNYSWQPANGLSASTGSSIMASPSNTTIYTVTGTNASGCTANSTVTVSVNQLPVVVVGSGAAICRGSSSPLITASGAVNYTWLPATGLSASTGAGVVASPSTTTTYTVSGSSASNCSNTATVTITVNPLPAVSAGAGAAICNGSSTSLVGSGALNYTWAPSIGLSSSTGSPVSASPTATTTYTVTGTNALGCTNTAPATITVYNLPAISSVTSNGPVCTGVNLNFMCNVSGGSGIYSYSWSGPAAFTSGLQNPAITAVTTAAVGTYSVGVTDSHGCTATGGNSTSVSIIASPVMTSIGNSGAICAGNNLSLTSAAAGGTGALAYIWFGPNSYFSTLSNPTISGATTAASGIYTVTVTDANGCAATGITTTVATVNPTPSAGTISGSGSICVGSTTTLTDAAPGGVWSSSAGLVSIGSSSGVASGIAISQETISYTVTNSYGCTNIATFAVNVEGSAGNIYTFTGTGVNGYTGDGSAGYLARIAGPRDIASDTAGNVYYCDITANVIRKIATNGIITTAIGNGTSGNGGDGGPATAASLSQANGICLDAAGNIYLSNTNSHTIRKVNAATGIITTIAGVAGTSGSAGDGGPATAATFNQPLGLCVDAAGNVYIADQNNYKVRKIDAVTGIINTIAGTGSSYYSGDGGPGTAARMSVTRGVALDNSGNLYIVDGPSAVIRKLNLSTGIISTIAGTGVPGNSGDGGPATAAQLNGPARIAFDGGKNLYITEINGNKARKINLATGIISTVAGTGTGGFAGDGGSASASRIYQPYGIAVGHAGNLFVTDAANRRIRVVTSMASVSISLAGATTVPAGTAITFTASSSIKTSYSSLQWQKNGVNTGTGTVTFTDPAPANGDTYRCILTVTPDCGTAFSDTSNSISITVAAPPAPFVSTAVSDPESSAGFNLYPNPLHNHFTIEGGDLKDGTVNISVFDQLGKIILAKTTFAANNSIAESVDMQSATPGIYLVTVTDASGKTIRLKCIKN